MPKEVKVAIRAFIYCDDPIEEPQFAIVTITEELLKHCAEFLLRLGAPEMDCIWEVSSYSSYANLAVWCSFDENSKEYAAALEGTDPLPLVDTEADYQPHRVDTAVLHIMDSGEIWWTACQKHTNIVVSTARIMLTNFRKHLEAGQ